MALTMAQAAQLADTALAMGRQRSYQPLTVAVLDPGGHVIVIHRDDGSAFMRPLIAVGKAWGALGMGVGSRDLGARAERVPHFFSAISALAPGGLVPVPGGVLVRLHTGELAGAVGISGDTSDHDEQCAVHGIEAVGLLAEPGAPS